jgi:hypothetical protein
MAQCPCCKQRFDVIHEGAEANKVLRESPGYSGPYHDFLSAIWHEWTLRSIGTKALSDSSLAYDVTLADLPHRSIFVETVSISRRERRQRARRGHRGRRGSIRVAARQDVFRRELYEPEAIREHVPHPLVISDEPEAFEIVRADVLEYRKAKHGVSARVCDRCSCTISVFVTVYIEHDAPHLMELVQRGLQRAGIHLATFANRQWLCFCPESLRD